MTTPGPAPTIQPQPTPIGWQVGDARVSDGSVIGVVMLQLVTGTTTLFLAPPDMRRFGQMLVDQADKLANMPIIATQFPIGLIPPTGNGRHPA